jgi:hypothetical protein
MSLTTWQKFGWFLMRLGMTIARIDYADVARYENGWRISTGIRNLHYD